MAVTAIKPRKRDVTRARVIQAAIDCIYEDGFNAANTNRIAERAGVTWGVLQYHFGDKDGLLQAVLDQYFDEFAASIAEVDPGEPDLRLRIDALVGVIWSLISSRQYRVSIAILRNAGKDVKSTIDGADKMRRWSREVARLWDKQFKGLIESPAHSETARRILFAALRGLADELNPRGRTSKKQLDATLTDLGDAIHFLLSS